jgi:LuxR family transcriptional regulator, regulator of acetate metabolism
MDDVVAVHDLIERLLPERLRRLRRASGVPVVFGGPTRPVAGTSSLVISRLAGTFGTSLRGLVVPSGLGLGGAVLRHRAVRLVDDYASTAGITHDYDRVVVVEERLTSVFAVPVFVTGAVRGVLYGAVRDPHPLGDRALDAATTIAARLQRDVEALLRPVPPVADDPRAEALDDLAAIVSATEDPRLRARLARIHHDLGGVPATPRPVPSGPPLSPRELDVLGLVARGESNLDIASELGLRPDTVKAYLRSGMRKLDVHNRTAAVHVARARGLLHPQPPGGPAGATSSQE